MIPSQLNRFYEPYTIPKPKTALWTSLFISNHKYIHIYRSLNPRRKKGEYTSELIQNSISWCARDGYHNYCHIFNELLNLNAKVTNIELEKGKKNSKAKTCWDCWTYTRFTILFCWHSTATAWAAWQHNTIYSVLCWFFFFGFVFNEQISLFNGWTVCPFSFSDGQISVLEQKKKEKYFELLQTGNRIDNRIIFWKRTIRAVLYCFNFLISI